MTHDAKNRIALAMLQLLIGSLLVGLDFTITVTPVAVDLLPDFVGYGLIASGLFVAAGVSARTWRRQALQVLAVVSIVQGLAALVRLFAGAGAGPNATAVDLTVNLGVAVGMIVGPMTAWLLYRLCREHGLERGAAIWRFNVALQLVSALLALIGLLVTLAIDSETVVRNGAVWLAFVFSVAAWGVLVAVAWLVACWRTRVEAREELLVAPKYDDGDLGAHVSP